MGDMADDFKAIRNDRKERREKFGVPCAWCVEFHPKREPSILLPGQRCGYRDCGYRDKRSKPPERVQLSRGKGWKMPPNTVKVDRTTKWGNPWTAENSGAVDPVMRFACETAPLLDLTELRGKNLACWCAIGKPCHADILLELANEKGKTCNAIK